MFPLLKCMFSSIIVRSKGLYFLQFVSVEQIVITKGL